MTDDNKIVQFKPSVTIEIKSFETEILLNPALAPKRGRQMYELGRCITSTSAIELFLEE
jgi:hypothetical protein